MKPPRFGLIIIGDEILSGRRADKHMAKVIELLSARGLELAWARYLPDDREAITAELRRTRASPDVVFVTGGIGATPDDHTRQAAAAAFERELELHPQARELILQRIAEMGQALSERDLAQRLRMGEFPQGADIIANPYNKIPGFQLERHAFVPGFPVMAWPMLEHILDSQYASWFAHGQNGVRALLVFETAESTLTPLMETLEAEFAGVRVFSLPSVGDATQTGPRARRHIELGVKGPVGSLEAAYARMKAGVLALGAEIDEAA